MSKTIHASASLIGILTLVLMAQWPASANGAGSAESPDKPGSQGQPSHRQDADLPPGVIGVSLHIAAEHIGEPAVLYVAHLHQEGPAHQAGLKRGDEITAVDGTPVTGKTYEQVVKMVRGEAGTAVKLGVKGETGTREISVTRVPSGTLYKGQKTPHGGPSR